MWRLYSALYSAAIEQVQWTAEIELHSHLNGRLSIESEIACWYWCAVVRSRVGMSMDGMTLYGIALQCRDRARGDSTKKLIEQ